MRKKLMTGICTLAMVLALGACGDGKSPAEDAGKENPVVTEQPSEGQEDTESKADSTDQKDEESDNKEEVTPAITDDENNGNEGTTEDEKDSEAVIPTIEKTVLWDANNVKITAQELNFTQLSERVSYAEVELLIENNNETTAKVIAGSQGYCCNAINGYMAFDGHFNENVKAGESITTTMEFFLGDLAVYGIDEIAEIQVGFDIEIEDGEEFYTGPQLIKTSVAESFDRTKNTYQETLNGEALGQNTEYVLAAFEEKNVSLMEGVELVSGALVTDGDGEAQLFLEVRNNTEEELRCNGISLDVNNLNVEGWDMIKYFIAPGCTCVLQYEVEGYYIPYSYWEAFGMTSLDKIDITLKITDRENLNELAQQKVSFAFGGTEPVVNTAGTEIYNQDGLRIVSKGVFADAPEEAENFCWVLLVESEYPETLMLKQQQGSYLYVNGVKQGGYVDYKLLPVNLEQGKYTAAYVAMDTEVLAAQGINSIADIETLEIGIVFETLKNKDVAKATVKAEGLNTATQEPAPEVTPEGTEPVETEGTLGEANVGEMVVFGAYEQDGDTANGAEAVEWLVLEVTDGKALLLSRYGLEAMPYNETEEAMTWENCSLRKWLNGEFYETAFSKEEKTEIVLTKLENKDNEEYGIEGGNDTEDKVFLLSVDEAKKYFAADTVVEGGRNYNTERAAKPSAYAATKPLTIVTNGSWYDGSSPYWLRSPGVLNHIAAVVDYNGEIYAFGHGVGEPKDMVRPAVWVEIGE